MVSQTPDDDADGDDDDYVDEAEEDDEDGEYSAHFFVWGVKAMLIEWFCAVDYDSDYEPAKGAAGQGASTADPYAGEQFTVAHVYKAYTSTRYFLLQGQARRSD